ncbi:MAG: hypothetical protein ACREBJ_00335, partial [Nitrosotalea sp.]
MEFAFSKEDSKCGPPIAIEDYEIRNLLKLANLSKKDVFMDLGSGFGMVVLSALEKTKVGKSEGVEYDIKRFLQCIEFMRDEYSPNKLKRVEFWRAFYQDFDFSRATVVYNGIYDFGTDEEMEMYEKIHEKKKKPLKIIKRDLPLFPYRPIKAIRAKKGSWFFLMMTPLKKYKLKNKDEWAKNVFGKKSTMDDVFTSYYQV